MGVKPDRRSMRRVIAVAKRDEHFSHVDNMMLMQSARSPLVRTQRLESGSMQALAMVVSVTVLPILVVFVLRDEVSLRAASLLNSSAASLFAGVFALWVFRQVVSFPGESRFAYILPVFGTTYGVIIATMVALRVQYSGIMLTVAFIAALVCAFLLTQLAVNRGRPRFFYLLAGDTGIVGATPDVEWVALAEPVLPDSDDESPIVADLHFDHSPEWERMIAAAAISGRAVYHTRSLRESLTGKVKIEHLSENSFGSLLPNLAYRKVKRLIDIGVSVGALLVLGVPLLIVALAVRGSSPGPALFRQERMGYRGRRFNVMKFRTMYHALQSADDPLRESITVENDSRITDLGRLLRRSRIDELPQLLNVLRGEMSLIGPRPEAVPLARWYEDELPFYAYRHIVRPGITGWAQIEQGHVAELEEVHLKLQYDFYYIKNFSAWLDALIAMRTIAIMFSGFGSK